MTLDHAQQGSSSQSNNEEQSKVEDLLKCPQNECKFSVDLNDKSGIKIPINEIIR